MIVHSNAKSFDCGALTHCLRSTNKGATSVASTRMRVTFTKEDDNLILKAVEQFGQKWAKIAKLPGLELHSADSIRGRYRDFLDPSLKTVEWTKSEDESLVIAHGQYGSKWTTIARQLPGRSRAAVRKRFLEIPQVVGFKHSSCCCFSLPVFFFFFAESS